MARSSKLAAVAVVVAVVVIAASALALRQALRCAGFAGPGVTAGELPPPVPVGHLRVATWNLRNFPLDERAGGSRARLRATDQHLRPLRRSDGDSTPT